VATITSPAPPRPPRITGQRIASTLLFLGLLVYIGSAVAMAVYLLGRAYSAPLDDFGKVALAALIAIIGTSLTACASVYAANRQALAAQQVEVLKLQTGAQLAEFNSGLTAQIEDLKAQSAQALERLKMYLDAGKMAYRDLSGAAAVYFYTLRSVALGSWDGTALQRAESGMIDACRHLIYVDEAMRDAWLGFWQEAQYVYREALKEQQEGQRSAVIQKELAKKVRGGGESLTFNDRYQRLEETAREAVKKVISD
jgi:hypothetical protein